MPGVTRRTNLAMLAALLGLLAAAPARAEESFAGWLTGLRHEALKHGISRQTLDRALQGIEILPAVIEADRRQPETRLSFAEYRRRVVNDRRVATGRELLARHRDLLSRVEARYHVPAEVIVALWGMESNFGERQGGYPVLAALATLAYEGRRASFFRKELLGALEIVERGHIEPELMQGSWAGAMGQNQFMPSTYLGYAVDFDGDGRRDIWRSLPDVFASTANYLARAGWDGRYIWGREVLVPDGFVDGRSGLDHRASLADWSQRGIRLPDGSSLPRASIQASLLRMDGGEAGSFLAYANFRALMAWNRSTYFGVSVGLLADSLRDG
ncbi:lytic murein transglycosylase [Benzoatithermus flavus]|uniref:Lytic murein transglycosylase n=1 Tax=Benzoatithermus flavus TaxID=3108223 RepID=A0ABU8XNJ3_9PROT